MNTTLLHLILEWISFGKKEGKHPFYCNDLKKKHFVGGCYVNKR